MTSRTREGLKTAGFLVFAGFILAASTMQVVDGYLRFFFGIHIYGIHTVYSWFGFTVSYLLLLLFGSQRFAKLWLAIFMLLPLSWLALMTIRLSSQMSDAFNTSMSQGVLFISIMVIVALVMVIWYRFKR